MRIKFTLTFLAGGAAGYVLGARAGRSRYEQIRGKADQIVHDPNVRDKASKVASTVTDQATTLAGAAGSTAAAKAKDLASSVRHRNDDTDPLDDSLDDVVVAEVDPLLVDLNGTTAAHPGVV
jgi:hypothetical protein